MGCKSGKPERLRDTCVIYYSREDKCWVAHSVRTDQIGMGDCVVHALADLMRAVEQVLRIAGGTAGTIGPFNRPVRDSCV